MVFCSSISDMNALLLCVAYVVSTFSVNAQYFPGGIVTPDYQKDTGKDTPSLRPGLSPERHLDMFPETNPERIGQSCPEHPDLVDTIALVIRCFGANQPDR